MNGANLNLVADGDSLTAGVGGYPWPGGLKEQYPEFAPMTMHNVAASGHTLQQMLSHGADAYWVNGMDNVLAAWGGTNDICNTGRTAAQTLQALTDYVAARLAAHPWKIIVGTLLPRQTGLGQSQTTAQNAVIDEYNALLRANYQTIGAHALFDVRRAGSPFNPTDYSMAAFEAMANNTGYWADGEVNNHIHLSSAGYTYFIPNFIIPAIKNVLGEPVQPVAGVVVGRFAGAKLRLRNGAPAVTR